MSGSINPAVAPRFAHAAQSVLFITLDSCRYDTFAESDLPALKAVGPLHKAMAPGYFTYASHAAMFVGFTPVVADGAAVPYANPKFARIFRLQAAGHPGHSPPLYELEGANIIEGFRRRGLLTLGSGAVGWFDPDRSTTAALVGSFDAFYYHRPRPAHLRAQLAWTYAQLATADRPVFLFLNIGETHVPYYFEGAPWDERVNPCLPFDPHGTNDAAECRRRQRACLQFIDATIAPLLEAFAEASIVICGDHADAWGEDGLWEHGIYHPKVLEVPLLLRLPLQTSQ